MGHPGCGGIKAPGESLNGGDLLSAMKANLFGQRENLLSYDCLKERPERSVIKLHGWVSGKTAASSPPMTRKAGNGVV